MKGAHFNKRPLSGRLRHCVDIEQRTTGQDPVTGAASTSWGVRWENVKAEIRPLSAKEFLSAETMQSKVTGTIVIRQRCDGDIDPVTMRVVHRTRRGAKVYNIHGALADPDSGEVYITMPVSEGVNDG